jgi:hypothetical protein
MKKSAYISSLVLFTVLLLSFSAANSWAGVKLYKMTGEITAIDLEYRTVVIEVPMVGKTFTVGGALAPEVVLEKGGHSVGLGDFQVGDQVVVTWKHTDEGHLILSLTAK